MKQTEIKIPKGCKATMRQDGDMIVIEYEEQRKFKNGDFVHWVCNSPNLHGTIILREDVNYGDAMPYFAHLTVSKDLLIKRGPIDFIGEGRDDGTTYSIATDEQQNEVLEAMHKVGKDWDAEKMEVVDFVWIPKYGEMYYYPSVGSASKHEITCYIPSNSADKYRVERGFVFKTKEEAISCAEKMLNSIK